MVKQRLLSGMETGGEIGIVQCKKGKAVIDYHYFRLSKNHRTLEYGTKEKESLTVIGEGERGNVFLCFFCVEYLEVNLFYF